MPRRRNRNRSRTNSGSSEGDGSHAPVSEKAAKRRAQKEKRQRELARQAAIEKAKADKRDAAAAAAAGKLKQAPAAGGGGAGGGAGASAAPPSDPTTVTTSTTATTTAPVLRVGAEVLVTAAACPSGAADSSGVVAALPRGGLAAMVRFRAQGGAGKDSITAWVWRDDVQPVLQHQQPTQPKAPSSPTGRPRGSKPSSATTAKAPPKSAPKSAPTSPTRPKTMTSGSGAGARFSASPCNVCGATKNLRRCTGCEAVWYCSPKHQQSDWKDHKPMCKQLRNNKKSAMIYGDRSGKLVGTFRWDEGTKFQPLPELAEELKPVVVRAKGWSTYLTTRLESEWQREMVAGLRSGAATVRAKARVPPEVVLEGVNTPPKDGRATLMVHPSILDGCSYPMTLVCALRAIKWAPPAGKELTIVMIGASERTEQRVLEQTNYFHDLDFLYPDATGIHFVLVGPELQAKRQSRLRTKQLHGGRGRLTKSLFRGTLQSYLSAEHDRIDVDTTVVVGYNTGLGSGSMPLMVSWLPGLAQLATMGLLGVFTCASENGDAPGEMAVMTHIVGANFVLPMSKSPFHAASTFHSAGARDTDYSCANCTVYAVRGFANGAKTTKANISTPTHMQRALASVFRALTSSTVGGALGAMAANTAKAALSAGPGV